MKAMPNDPDGGDTMLRDTLREAGGNSQVTADSTQDMGLLVGVVLLYRDFPLYSYGEDL